MRGRFTLDYWRDGNWYVGRLIEHPGVFSQRATLQELRVKIQDAYDLIVARDGASGLPGAGRRVPGPEMRGVGPFPRPAARRGSDLSAS